MTMTLDNRPDPAEVAPYHRTYVDRVGDGDILVTLGAQRTDIEAIGALAVGDPAVGDHSYAPGKWTIKELIGHCVDTERVFAYRALHVGRGGAQELAGFDQDPWVVTGEFGARDLPGLIDEWVGVRADTVRLLRSLPPAAWGRSGVADGKPVSVRGLAWLTAGHAEHHLAVLHERYL